MKKMGLEVTRCAHAMNRATPSLGAPSRAERRPGKRGFFKVLGGAAKSPSAVAQGRAHKHMGGHNSCLFDYSVVCRNFKSLTDSTKG